MRTTRNNAPLTQNEIQNDANLIESENKKLAQLLSTKTGMEWTGNVDGVYCQAGFETKDPEEAKKILSNKMRESGITLPFGSARFTRNPRHIPLLVVDITITKANDLLTLRKDLIQDNSDQVIAKRLKESNENLAKLLSEYTKVPWTADVNGIYCEVVYGTAAFSKEGAAPRTDVERIFITQLKHLGIAYSGRQGVLDSMTHPSDSRASDNKVRLKASFTTQSDLIKMRESLLTANKRLTPLGGEVKNTTTIGDWRFTVDQTEFAQIQNAILHRHIPEEAVIIAKPDASGKREIRIHTSALSIKTIKTMRQQLIDSGIVSSDKALEFISENRVLFTSKQGDIFSEKRLNRIVELESAREELHTAIKNCANKNSDKYKDLLEQRHSLDLQIDTVRNVKLSEEKYEHALTLVKALMAHKTERAADARQYTSNYPLVSKLFCGISKEQKFNAIDKFIGYLTGEIPDTVLTKKDFDALNQGKTKEILKESNFKFELKATDKEATAVPKPRSYKA